MRISRRVATLAAATGFAVALLSGALAVPAQAVGNPADCTVTNLSNGASMTCTSRPPSQTWYMTLMCINWRPTIQTGNYVTGNGTSTVECIEGVPYYYPTFHVLA